MDTADGNTFQLWPLLIYALAVFLLAGVMLGLSYLLGERHKERYTHEEYESGIKITGKARLRFSSKFYLVAMFFVIFDLEAVFIIAWAISFRDAGWSGYLVILIFILILLAVLIYEWRIGALDFGPSGKKIINAVKKSKRKNI